MTLHVLAFGRRLICALGLVCFIVAMGVQSAAAQRDASAEAGVIAAPINPGPTTADMAAAGALPQSVGTATEAERARFEFERRAQEIAYSARITMLSMATGLGFLLFFTVILFFSKSGLSTEASRNFIVLVVVISAILLIVMGYTEQQVAPAFGLLGTILGYVFGRVQSEGASATGTGGDQKTNAAQGEQKDGQTA